MRNAKVTTEIVVVEDPSRVQQVFRDLTHPVEHRHILCRAHDESTLGFFVRAYRRIQRLADSFEVARICVYDGTSSVYEGHDGALCALRRMVTERLGAFVGDAFGSSEDTASAQRSPGLLPAATTLSLSPARISF